MLSGSVSVGPQGRIVIPAPLRRELHLKTGDELVARIDEGRLILETREAALARIQALFKSVAKGRSLVDDLFAERREEARREAQ